ncbi:MAG: glycosyltransferase family 9 protein [Candidatus Omnitrophota bacterium]|nr:MAG: glycosyltransferase family 9 protein [Candidatus Omnitrophota bacterium]
MKPEIKSIIINFPTNIGDTILGLPTLDRIKTNYPQAKITAIVSNRTKDFLTRNSFVDEIVLFDKTWTKSQKRKFALALRGKYDMLVDLKNSFLPLIVGPKLRTPFLRFFPKNLHIKEKYLSLIKRITPLGQTQKSDCVLSEEEKSKWEKLNMVPSIFIACTSLTAIKCYPYEYLKQVVEELAQTYPVVIIGSEKDRQFYADILSMPAVLDLVGKTQMNDVFYLLKKYAKVLLAVDSSIMHMGSYLDIPIVGLFGPTHPKRSYPYSERSIVLWNKGLTCTPCERAQCRFNIECMKIKPQEVVQAIKKLWQQ